MAVLGVFAFAVAGLSAGHNTHVPWTVAGPPRKFRKLRSVLCGANVVSFLSAKSGLLGGGFKCFLFSPLPGEMILFD